MPKPPAPHVFRTGRFHCEMTGRHLMVRDLAMDVEITAKLIEWSELFEAMTVAKLAQQLAHRQQRRDPG